MTLVFGILPILTANRIRPAIILRPNETHLPGVGVLHSLIALVLVVLVIGVIAGQIIGDMRHRAASRSTVWWSASSAWR